MGLRSQPPGIVECILKDENSIMSVSHVMTGEFGLRNIAISLPCIINAGGVKQIVNIVPTDQEIADVVTSARKLPRYLPRGYAKPLRSRQSAANSSTIIIKGDR